MLRKTKKKLSGIGQWCQNNMCHISNALLILILLFLLSKHKSLIVILIFEILDILKNIIKQSMQFLPLEFRFIFGVTAAYFYTPWIAILIFFLGIINRLFMVMLEPMHFIKGIRHIPIFFLTYYLSGFPFFYVAMAMLILNYILKYLFGIAKEPAVIFEEAVYLATNFVFAMMFFYIISIIYFYLPFLA